MIDLRTLTHEQLISTVTSRLGTSVPAAAGTRVSTYLSEPTASPLRVERYKRTRRAPRPLTPAAPPVAPAPTGLELTYADFIASASRTSSAAAAQVA